MPVGAYRFRIFLRHISAENRVSRFKRCSDHPDLDHRGCILPYSDPECPHPTPTGLTLNEFEPPNILVNRTQ